MFPSFPRYKEDTGGRGQIEPGPPVPEGDHDESLPWFDRCDKDFVELQKVILNPELLDSFKYYTRFRYRFKDILYKINFHLPQNATSYSLFHV